MILLSKVEEIFRNILNWIEKCKIIVLKERVVVVDEAGPIHVVFQNVQIGDNRNILEKPVRMKAKGISKKNRRIDDLKFSERISSLAVMVINEIALLLPPGQNRDIFIEIATKKNISNVAAKYHMSNDELYQSYRQSFTLIKKRIDFIVGYQEAMTRLEQKVSFLIKAGRNKDQQIETLANKLKEFNYQVMRHEEQYGTDRGLPAEVKGILCRRLEEFGLKSRAIMALNNNGYYTVEDILIYLQRHGVYRLENIPGFGHRSRKILQQAFIKEKIIDDKGGVKSNSKTTSQYFKYL